MTLEQLRAYCLGLPGATEDIKWGADLCFCVGAKMFAITGVDTAEVRGVSLKTSPELFPDLCERSGVKPAPYLARYKWVYIETFDDFSDKELKELIRLSYDLVMGKLPAKIKKTIY